MKKMRLKRTKKKKFSKIKMFIYVMIIYISFAYTFYDSLREKKMVSNEEFINILLKTGNANLDRNFNIISIVNKTVEWVFGIDFKKPVSFFNTSILKYGVEEKSMDTISLEYSDDYSEWDELKSVSEYMNNPNSKEVVKPVVYLYNSHQLENYDNDALNVYGVTPNVLMGSYLLKEKLIEKGIPTIVEETNMSEILEANNWDYAKSYDASRELVQQNMEKYTTLQYFIDIHRDSVSRDYSTVVIKDVTYAKVMFVVGMDYDTWEVNYKLAEDLNSIMNELYPGMSRGIIKKQGLKVNGVYNQDLSGGVMLLEVGGVENKIEEVYQTMIAFSDILSVYIKGAE